METNPKPFVVECMYCHRVKSESGEYVAKETPENADTLHGCCSDCTGSIGGMSWDQPNSDPIADIENAININRKQPAPTPPMIGPMTAKTMQSVLNYITAEVDRRINTGDADVSHSICPDCFRERYGEDE